MLKSLDGGGTNAKCVVEGEISFVSRGGCAYTIFRCEFDTIRVKPPFPNTLGVSGVIESGCTGLATSGCRGNGRFLGVRLAARTRFGHGFRWGRGRGSMSILKEEF